MDSFFKRRYKTRYLFLKIQHYLFREVDKMRIKFISPKAGYGKVKCTVHKNGKLGFSQAAIRRLNVTDSKHYKIGVNEEDRYDDSLYLMIAENEDRDTYNVNKAGNYYYLNTRNLFDELNIDYKTKKIIYDIEEIEYEGHKIYRLNKRELDRSK
jgi:hypothetical protein